MVEAVHISLISSGWQGVPPHHSIGCSLTLHLQLPSVQFPLVVLLWLPVLGGIGCCPLSNSAGQPQVRLGSPHVCTCYFSSTDLRASMRPDVEIRMVKATTGPTPPTQLHFLHASPHPEWAQQPQWCSHWVAPLGIGPVPEAYLWPPALEVLYSTFMTMVLPVRIYCQCDCG